MDREEFIIAVYLMVCAHYDKIIASLGRPLRRGGFKPKLTDKEAICIEICAEQFGLRTDKAIFNHFKNYYKDMFPSLGHRTTFIRQTANLYKVKAALQADIIQALGAHLDTVQPIDTVPLPICQRVRASRSRNFDGLSDYGYCASKKMHYYGFKLGLRVNRQGLITRFCLVNARSHDIKYLPTLVEGFQGIVPADKGFIDFAKQNLLRQQGTLLVTPKKANTKPPFPIPAALAKRCRFWRKRVETVASQLTRLFSIDSIRVHDMYHFTHRVIRKILAHTVAVAINIKYGYKPLAIAQLANV